MILANCIPILIGKYISFICTSSGTSTSNHSPCKTYVFTFVNCSHTEIVTAIGLYIILAIAVIALIIALVLFIKIMIED